MTMCRGKVLHHLQVVKVVPEKPFILSVPGIMYALFDFKGDGIFEDAYLLMKRFQGGMPYESILRIETFERLLYVNTEKAVMQKEEDTNSSSIT